VIFALQLMSALSSLVRSVLFQGSVERTDVAALFPGPVWLSFHPVAIHTVDFCAIVSYVEATIIIWLVRLQFTRTAQTPKVLMSPKIW